MKTYDVIIVGAGLSGLSCGVHLVDAGKKVLILEGRKIVGGRTSSWNEDGMDVESGLHRFLGFYQILPDFLKHVGIDIDKMLVWEDEVEIILPDDGPRGVIALSTFRKPLKMVQGLIGNNDLIPPADKVKLIPFVTAGVTAFHTEPNTLDTKTVAEYAKDYGLSEELITNLLIPFTAGIFFLPPNRYSAYAFFGFFAMAVRGFYKLGVGAFAGGMTEVMCEPIAQYITKNGGTVRRNAPVKKLLIEANIVRGVVLEKETIHAGHVIIATGLDPAKHLIKPHFGKHPWFQGYAQTPYYASSYDPTGTRHKGDAG